MANDMETQLGDPALSEVDEQTQMNVRMLASRVRIAKRLATQEKQTLAEYISHLIDEDIRRKQDDYNREIEGWMEKAKRNKELAEFDLKAVIGAKPDRN